MKEVSPVMDLVDGLLPVVGKTRETGTTIKFPAGMIPSSTRPVSRKMMLRAVFMRPLT